nr:MAG TPA: hypothetical protein [Caudoviricetes sp.]
MTGNLTRPNIANRHPILFFNTTQKHLILCLKL